MRRVYLITLFLLFAPITLFFSFFSLIQTKNAPSADSQEAVLGTSAPLQLYSAIPPTLGSISQEITASDANPVIIEKFLKRYNSPITGYADVIYASSKKWDVDYGLILAIAQCESNLCKKIPSDSYNCWGFENGDTKFSSWEKAFDQVAKTLREGYLNYGLTTPEEIMPKYAPPSVEKGGPWAKCVSQYLSEVHY